MNKDKHKKFQKTKIKKNLRLNNKKITKRKNFYFKIKRKKIIKNLKEKFEEKISN